jgi:hypothetical protein
MHVFEQGMRFVVFLLLLAAAVHGLDVYSTLRTASASASPGRHKLLHSSITLTASPEIVTVNRGMVTVSWSNVASPTVNDWVGVFTPVPQNLTGFVWTTPVKLKMCTLSPSHLSSGKGSFEFSLLNMRGDYVFALFRSGVVAATTAYYSGPYSSPVAVSNVVKLDPALQDAPHSIHLGLTDTPSEMSVMWTTKTLGQPVVYFDKTSAFETRLKAASPQQRDIRLLRLGVAAQTTSYSATDMCPGGPADSAGFIHPGQIHRAIMTNLEPSTNYTYVVGDKARGSLSFSDEFTFVSAPAVLALEQVIDADDAADPAAAAETASAAADGVRLLVVADMGTSEAGFDGATNGGNVVESVDNRHVVECSSDGTLRESSISSARPLSRSRSPRPPVWRQRDDGARDLRLV